MNSTEQQPHEGEQRGERDAERLRRLMRSEIAHTRARGGMQGAPPPTTGDVSAPLQTRDLTSSAGHPAHQQAPTMSERERPAVSSGRGSSAEPRPLADRLGRRRWRRRLAPIVAIGAGSILALLAYAGGGDLLTEWFGSYRATPVADTYDALPAPVLLDSLRRDSLAKPAIVAARDTAARAAAADTAAAKSDSAAAPDDSAARPDAPALTEAPARREAPPARDTVVRRDTVAARRPLSGRYIVQVRATADLQQAEALARKLRRRGLAGVSITESSREGETTYRVRYGAFTSEEEARASAAENGLSDVWIVRR